MVTRFWVVNGDSSYHAFMEEAFPDCTVEMFGHEEAAKRLTTDEELPIGILFTGGADINPVLYGQEPHPAALCDPSNRDTVEESIIAHITTKNLPVALFGICRGSQLLWATNVGPLYQHIEAHGLPKPQLHLGTIPFDKRGFFEALVSPTFRVTSTHHQAACLPEKLPRGAGVVLIGSHGGIDAIEAWYAHHCRIIGVQFHPEYDYQPYLGRRFAVDLFRTGVLAFDRERRLHAGLRKVCQNRIFNLVKK